MRFKLVENKVPDNRNMVFNILKDKYGLDTLVEVQNDISKLITGRFDNAGGDVGCFFSTFSEYDMHDMTNEDDLLAFVAWLGYDIYFTHHGYWGDADYAILYPGGSLHEWQLTNDEYYEMTTAEKKQFLSEFKKIDRADIIENYILDSDKQVPIDVDIIEENFEGDSGIWVPTMWDFRIPSDVDEIKHFEDEFGVKVTQDGIYYCIINGPDTNVVKALLAYYEATDNTVYDDETDKIIPIEEFLNEYYPELLPVYMDMDKQVPIEVEFLDEGWNETTLENIKKANFITEIDPSGEYFDYSYMHRMPNGDWGECNADGTDIRHLSYIASDDDLMCLIGDGVQLGFTYKLDTGVIYEKPDKQVPIDSDIDIIEEGIDVLKDQQKVHKSTQKRKHQSLAHYRNLGSPEARDRFNNSVNYGNNNSSDSNSASTDAGSGDAGSGSTGV